MKQLFQEIRLNSNGGKMEDSQETNIVPANTVDTQKNLIPQDNKLLTKQETTLPAEIPPTKVIHINKKTGTTENKAAFPLSITLYNQTNKRLHIHNGGEEIIIPALGSKTIALEEVQTKETLSTFRNYDFLSKVTKQLILKGWLKFTVQWSGQKAAIRVCHFSGDCDL